MKNRRAFRILLIGFVSAALTLLIVYIIHGPQKVDVFSKTMDINKVEKIYQGDTYYIAKPKKILCYKGIVFILDVKFFRILAYGNNGYSHFIGRPGQGPGEISQPISMTISKDKLYVLNSPDRIEVFDLFGKYLRTIRLKIQNTTFKSIWDFKISDEKIYVSLDIGEVRVQRYDLNGRWIDNFIAEGDVIDPDKTVIANPNDIYIVPGLSALILFNRFSGAIEEFNLKSGTFIKKLIGYDRIVEERISLLKREMKDKNTSKGKVEVKGFLMFHANLDEEKMQLHILPSQSSVNRENMRDIIYTVNLEDMSMERKKMQFVGIKKKYIRNCCIKKDSMLFIDDELNLFKGGFK